MIPSSRIRSGVSCRLRLGLFVLLTVEVVVGLARSDDELVGRSSPRRLQDAPLARPARLVHCPGVAHEQDFGSFVRRPRAALSPTSVPLGRLPPWLAERASCCRGWPTPGHGGGLLRRTNPEPPDYRQRGR
jgi:hypothetical protein